MSFYTDRILPHLIQLSMQQEPLTAYRRRVVPGAEGRVLEIGVGSGLNLPLYRAATTVTGLDPSPRLLAMAREASRRASAEVELLLGTAEAIPVDDCSIDTVVTTWTLCSIPDAQRALEEIRRVLKPGGRVLFVEHGRAPDARVRRWQDRITPVWKHIGGGCHLNRPIPDLFEGAGFRIERIEAGYMPGPKPMTFTYEGAASIR
ncbi:MAG: class I SAM-dependent methyltransferase [Vicinamibacterales bacterium]